MPTQLSEPAAGDEMEGAFQANENFTKRDNAEAIK